MISLLNLFIKSKKEDMDLPIVIVGQPEGAGYLMPSAFQM